MKKLIKLSIVFLCLMAFKSDKDYFVGKIVFKNMFTDLKGNDITEKIAPLIGRESYYYIDRMNYKAYDEANNWIQLYNAESNTYYYFSKDKTAQKIDGSKETSEKFNVTKLDIKEDIAGYECRAIQVETESQTTVYYYNSTIKTDPRVFSRHNFGNWNKYLKATGGALSLKFVMTDPKSGYIWTSVATEVTRQKLTQDDFKFPEEIKLKE